ncbi:MAG: transcription elongation factor GreA [Cytophagales bacterium]|nr:transcription elongation factor GreA [Cytophagales bacterium]
MSTNYYTKEGLEKMKAELQELKTRGRAKMAEQISEARDKGDLRENAEYDAAKEAQGLLELRISKLADRIASAQIIDETKLDTSKVTVMSRVWLEGEGGTQIDYLLVAAEETDIKSRKISVDSPLGKALIGKKEKDKVEVQTPGGLRRFQIIKIAFEYP